MQLVYPLAVPGLEEFLTESFHQELFHSDSIISADPSKPSAGYARRHCRDILKEKYWTWRGYNWDQSLLFVKANGWYSHIHRDSPRDSDMPWAINWIQGGSGTMNFWTREQLGAGQATIDSGGAPNLTWYTDQKPWKSYDMQPGCYLVNADVPHNAHGHGVRYAVSIRSTTSFDLTWEAVVNSFKDLI